MSDHAVVVSTIIERSRDDVWNDLHDIKSHASWMHDAVAIRFLTEEVEGVGTRFECDTKVGPFSLTDIMEVTSWEEPHRMGVRHVGFVEGRGAFILEKLTADRTQFRWEEDLTFPWLLGGPVGAFLARPILRYIWKGNLARLKSRIEQR